jgi:hypothetical protein
MTAGNVQQEVTQVTGDHSRVWLMLAESHLQDPQGATENWLDSSHVRVLAYSFYHNRLVLFAPVLDTPAVPVNNLAPQHTLRGVIGGNVLLGYDLPASEYRPDDVVHLGLYWREMGPSETSVELVDKRGRVLDRQPLTSHNDGLVRRQQADFAVHTFTPSGRCHFRLVSLQELSQPISFGTLLIQGTRPLPFAGDPTHPLEAQLGEGIQFHGYDLTPEGALSAGGELTYDLYWEPTMEIALDYTVFVHLLGPFNPVTGGPVWAQHDGQPMEGKYPTHSWLTGRVVKDRHVLALPPDMPPGEYQVEVGLYDLASGMRLPVIPPDGMRDTRILLDAVRIVQ